MRTLFNHPLSREIDPTKSTLALKEKIKLILAKLAQKDKELKDIKKEIQNTMAKLDAMKKVSFKDSGNLIELEKTKQVLKQLVKKYKIFESDDYKKEEEALFQSLIHYCTKGLNATKLPIKDYSSIEETEKLYQSVIQHYSNMNVNNNNQNSIGDLDFVYFSRELFSAIKMLFEQKYYKVALGLIKQGNPYILMPAIGDKGFLEFIVNNPNLLATKNKLDRASCQFLSLFARLSLEGPELIPEFIKLLDEEIIDKEIEAVIVTLTSGYPDFTAELRDRFKARLLQLQEEGSIFANHTLARCEEISHQASSIDSDTDSDDLSLEPLDQAEKDYSKALFYLKQMLLQGMIFMPNVGAAYLHRLLERRIESRPPSMPPEMAVLVHRLEQEIQQLKDEHALATEAQRVINIQSPSDEGIISVNPYLLQISTKQRELSTIKEAWHLMETLSNSEICALRKMISEKILYAYESEHVLNFVEDDECNNHIIDISELEYSLDEDVVKDSSLKNNRL